MWNPYRDRIESFLGFLSSYDLFVTARYHGAIFASILRKPVVAIEIENKLALVSELLKVGSRLWAYPFHAEQCLEHIAEFDRHYSRSVACLDNVVEEQMYLAGRMVDDFVTFIQGNDRDLESTDILPPLAK